jgi:hypothetical protein
MIQRPGLLIFIDSLGFRQAERAHLFEFLEDRHPMIPGFGYSVNIQTEMVTGVSPDGAGFFCDWMFAPHGSRFRRYERFLRVLARISESSHALNTLVHRLLNRFLFQCLAIPFDHLPWLERKGRYIFATGDCELLRRCNLISYASVPGGPGEKDEWVFQEALRSLRTRDRPVCVTFVDLDHIGHHDGPESAAFQAKLKWLDEHVRALAETLWSRHPDAPVVVMSDHGVSTVNEVRPVDLESIAGPPSPAHYTYFVDSTLVRVWTPAATVREKLQRYLESVAVVVSPEERAAFGITSNLYGDLIAVAPDGVIFSPNFQSGRAIPAGMHGYHPLEPSQYGLWSTSKSNGKAPAGELRPQDVYAQLKETFVA